MFSELTSLVERLLTFSADYTELEMVLSRQSLDESGVFKLKYMNDYQNLINFESEMHMLNYYLYPYQLAAENDYVYWPVAADNDLNDDKDHS